MAGFFSPGTLEQVRAANDIVDVIGSYVPLKRAGTNFVALCPFHREKSPSFNVNPQKQIFHCFGCHKGGDVFTFVKEHENIPFPDAVRRLAERAKIPLEMDQQPGQSQNRQIKDTLLHIHEQIAQRWQNALANEAAGQPARDYLAQRGVSEEAVKLFRLGAAPGVWDDTVNWAKSKGFEMAVMEQAGLILHKEGSDHYYDRFRGRLIFPICDEQGRVVGFSGRILPGDESPAKYVNSPETPIFTKGRVFFGLDKSKRAMLDAQCAIVCEGQLDLIACYMSGAQNIVAPQGTALTADHARILKRYVEEVVLCFDSDNAGQNATVRSLDSLLASGLAVRVAVVPAPHDPDSFIKEFGGAAFKELISNAEGFFDYYLQRLCSNNDLKTDKGRLIVMYEMAEAVNKTRNLVLINKYAQKTAFSLGVTEHTMRAEFDKVAKSVGSLPAGESAASELAAQSFTRPGGEEYALLQLVFQKEELADWLAGHLEINWLLHGPTQKILDKRIRSFQTSSWQGIPAFLEALADPELQNLVTEAVNRNYMEGASGIDPDRDRRDHLRGRTIPNVHQQLADIVLRLRNRFIERQNITLTQRSADPKLSDAERLELLHQQQALRQLKRQPLTPRPPGEEEPF